MISSRFFVKDLTLQNENRRPDMIKIFVTGDNHFGRKFDRYTNKEKLIESRFECLENMIRKAEEEHCEFFVITGDLFDNNYSITQKVVKRVVSILAGFDQTVLVLPGNHDFYTGNENLWKYYCSEASAFSNIVVLKEYKPFELECSEGTVIFYPAYCDSKHSDSNRLAWIKNAEINSENQIKIGIAHGALEGLAIDTEGKYFPMRRMELNSIPVDCWLIGHAHVAEPLIAANEEVSGYTIFNAGTHEQLDLNNKTEGNAFVISIENIDGKKKILAKRIVTGKIRYFDEKLELKATDTKSLEDALTELVETFPDESVVRVTISGSIEATEYQDKEKLYEKFRERFLEFIPIDDSLSEKITKEKIENEFSEIGFVAKFLEELMDNPTELQMAYDVVKELKK